MGCGPPPGPALLSRRDNSPREAHRAASWEGSFGIPLPLWESARQVTLEAQEGAGRLAQEEGWAGLRAYMGSVLSRKPRSEGLSAKDTPPLQKSRERKPIPHPQASQAHPLPSLSFSLSLTDTLLPRLLQWLWACLTYPNDFQDHICSLPPFAPHKSCTSLPGATKRGISGCSVDGPTGNRPSLQSFSAPSCPRPAHTADRFL